MASQGSQRRAAREIAGWHGPAQLAVARPGSSVGLLPGAWIALGRYRLVAIILDREYQLQQLVVPGRRSRPPPAHVSHPCRQLLHR